MSLFLDNLREREKMTSELEENFERSRHDNFSFVILSQENYKLPKRMFRANGILYHFFQPNNFRDVRIFYHDKAKAKMDKIVNQKKFLTSFCWNEPRTIDMTKDK